MRSKQRNNSVRLAGVLRVSRSNVKRLTSAFRAGSFAARHLLNAVPLEAFQRPCTMIVRVAVTLALLARVGVAVLPSQVLDSVGTIRRVIVVLPVIWIITKVFATRFPISASLAAGYLFVAISLKTFQLSFTLAVTVAVT